MMLTIYQPKYEDLWFKQLMLSDEDTMSYNHAYGGMIPFPEDRWQGWYHRWIADGDGRRYYRYLRNDLNEFVGEISYHYDEEKDVYLADVVVYSRYRKKGFGSQALDLLCSIAKRNGIQELYDEIAIDNPSLGLFLRHGFSEVSRTEETILLKKLLQETDSGLHGR